ncbi:MAG TPA: dethiobiotin synthase [Solirubrobacterales bacterium]|nr:dethiobiotin synthase [Solirubrobacterales bacterium]
MGEPAAGVFVTGTGTEVGKTVVAAAIAHTLAAEGKRVAVFKPAVTGLDELPADGPISRRGGDLSAHRPLADHELLRMGAGSGQSDEEIAPYRYGPPASPHLAAEMAGEEIEPGRLLAAARTAAASADALVCEGVGGLLVPLAGRLCKPMGDKSAPPYLVRDFAADLGLPLVVAASPGLGTINHTLLTIEVARAAGLEVAAVVLTPWPTEPSEIERSNRDTIASLGDVPVQVLPHLDPAHPGTWPPLQVPMGR